MAARDHHRCAHARCTITGDRDIAEDLTHETFLTAARIAPRYDGRASARPARGVPPSAPGRRARRGCGLFGDRRAEARRPARRGCASRAGLPERVSPWLAPWRRRSDRRSPLSWIGARAGRANGGAQHGSAQSRARSRRPSGCGAARAVPVRRNNEGRAALARSTDGGNRTGDGRETAHATKPAMSMILLGAGVVVGSYLSGTYLPFRGVHDLLVPGAIFRTSSAAVALTFDDGPHPRWTPQILDVLARANASASFFLIGENAARHPEIVRRIARDGHCIGNHGWSHRSMNRLSSRELAEEIDRCQGTIATIIGKPPRFLRPPFGRRDYRTYQAARDRGLTPALWSLDSHDWLHADAARIARRLRRASAGDVVLLHDGRPNAAATVSAATDLLAQLERRGVPARALTQPGSPDA